MLIIGHNRLTSHSPEGKIEGEGGGDKGESGGVLSVASERRRVPEERARSSQMKSIHPGTAHSVHGFVTTSSESGNCMGIAVLALRGRGDALMRRGCVYGERAWAEDTTAVRVKDETTRGHRRDEEWAPVETTLRRERAPDETTRGRQTR